jgi:hypothetical protein
MTPEDKARRDLARLEAEREKLFHGTPTADNDDKDPMEVLGRRIARILGPVMAAAMLVYLLGTLLPRS